MTLHYVDANWFRENVTKIAMYETNIAVGALHESMAHCIESKSVGMSLHYIRKYEAESAMGAPYTHMAYYIKSESVNMPLLYIKEYETRIVVGAPRCTHL